VRGGAASARRGLAAVPRGVWALGLVSMCMDLSSELIHSLLPLYMAVGLGASAFVIGIVEGVAEALALVVKVFSGVISDVFFGFHILFSYAVWGLVLLPLRHWSFS